MIQIPDATRKFIQGSGSDTFGNLYATKNCDFDSNKGSMQLSRRLILNTATADLATLTSYPVGFAYFVDGVGGSPFFTAAGLSGAGRVFRASSIDGTFSVDAGTGTPTTVDSTTSDIKTILGQLCVSLGSSVKYLVGTTWTAMSIGTANAPGPMCQYGGRGYLGSAGKVHSWNSANSTISPTTSGTDGANTNPNSCFIPNMDETIIKLEPNSLGIFILTVNTNGAKGHIYFWDGVSTQVNSQWKINAAGALTGVCKGEQLYILDSNGAFGIMNAGTFTKLAEIYRKYNKPLYNPYSSTNQRFVHPNGSSIINGIIHINLDLTNYDAAGHLGTQEDCNPSGIWIFDQSDGSSITPGNLKHKYSFGLTKSEGTIVDYGSFRISGAGGLADSLTAQSPVTNNGRFLVGCSYYTDATTATSGIFYDDTNDTLKKAGYFLTPKISAGADPMSINDNFVKAYVFHDSFVNQTDRVVVKYRTIESTPVEGTITWINSTSFYTSLNLSSFVIGDEIEVLSGIGAGLPSHISTIQVSDSGYIVSVDETYVNATGRSRVRFDKWYKAGTIQDADDFDEVPISAVSTWIQFKLFFIWTNKNEFTQLLISNHPNKKVE